jgi:hypothetical protein
MSHVAGMGETINAHNISVGKPEWKNHSEDLDVDGKIILECTLGKQRGKMWTDACESGQGPMEGSCGNGNELLVP